MSDLNLNRTAPPLKPPKPGSAGGKSNRSDRPSRKNYTKLTIEEHNDSDVDDDVNLSNIDNLLGALNSPKEDDQTPLVGFKNLSNKHLRTPNAEEISLAEETISPMSEHSYIDVEKGPQDKRRDGGSSNRANTGHTKLSKKQREELAKKEMLEKTKNTKVSTFGQLLCIFFAFCSISASSSSYGLVGKSATYVAPILENWSSKPLEYVYFLYPNATSCPDDSSVDGTYMTWPGMSSLGCACPSGSSESSTYSSTCSIAQLNANCVDDTAIDSKIMDTWRGTKLCLQRAGQAIFENNVVRPLPTVDIPHACGDGYHRCGRTSMDAWRATCAPSADDCPITFLGGKDVLSFYGVQQSTFDAYTFSRVPQPFLDYSNNIAPNDTLYIAESSLVVPLQLPLVQFTMSFMQYDNSVPNFYGPCLDHSVVADISQASYTGTATYTDNSVTAATNSYPSSCANLDPRWQSYDYQKESDWLLDNLLQDSKCKGLTYTQAINSNYWTSGTICSLASSGDNIGLQCESGIDPSTSCGSDDMLCKNTFYQSQCGRLVQSALAIRDGSNGSKNIGLFKRNEIYWKQSCSSNYESVQKNNEPLQTALTAQLAFLATNVFFNTITIMVATIVLCVYVFEIDLPCIPGNAKEDAKYLKWLERRMSLACKVFKLGPCIAAIVYLSYIVDFYTEVSEAQCSDPTTNAAFDTLGATLPAAQNSNIITLAMDVAQLVLPPLWLYYQTYKHRKKVQSVMSEAPRKLPEGARHKVGKAALRRNQRRQYRKQLRVARGSYSSSDESSPESGHESSDDDGDSDQEEKGDSSEDEDTEFGKTSSNGLLNSAYSFVTHHMPKTSEGSRATVKVTRKTRIEQRI